MTGWIAYTNQMIFTAHADILLSSKVSDKPLQKLPVFVQLDQSGSIVDRNTSGFVTTGLCQKIVLVSDQVAYVWAGSLRIATQIGVKLQAICNDDLSSWSEKDIFSHFEALAEPFQGEDITALIVVALPDGNFMQGINCKRFTTPAFKECWSGGDGEGSFYESMCDVLANVDVIDSDDSSGELINFEDVGKAITRIEYLDARLQHLCMNEAFRAYATGGAVDTLIREPDPGTCKLSKLAGWLYVLWDERTLYFYEAAPSTIVKRSYSNGYLGICLYSSEFNSFTNFTIPSPIVPIDFELGMDVHNIFGDDVRGVFNITIYLNGSWALQSESVEAFRRGTFKSKETGRIRATAAYLKKIFPEYDLSRGLRPDL